MQLAEEGASPLPSQGGVTRASLQILSINLENIFQESPESPLYGRGLGEASHSSIAVIPGRNPSTAIVGRRRTSKVRIS